MRSIKINELNLVQIVWKLLNSNAFVIVSLLIMLSSLVQSSNEFFDWTKQKNTSTRTYNINADGAGYYIYLPQWFIYQPGNFDFLDEIESNYPDARFGDNFSKIVRQNNYINKYYSGTAVFISPFFLIAHGVESIKGGEADGYSETYQLFVSIAALFYWLIGALAIFLLLQKLKIPPFYAIFTVFVITFGSNLSHYVIYVPSYSHVYSFACVSWIVYIALRWASTNKKGYLYLLGFLLGLSFLIRPTNLIIVIFIPFLFENPKDFYSKIQSLFSKERVALLISIILASLPVMFHFWNTYLQINEFKINTYSSEGFDHLSDPYIFEVLFGVRRGIFFYAPALLFSAFGLIYLFRKRKNLFWGFIVVFSVFTYITSSWWCWWYGGGFSMRPYIDFLVIFSIPLAFMLKHLNKVLKTFFFGLLLFCVWLTQIYSYQVAHFILHYDNITAKQFSEVFLKTADRFQWHPFLTYAKIPEEYSMVKESLDFEQFNLTGIKIESDNSDYFAGKIKGQYKLENPNDKPFYQITYFTKSDTQEESIYFGNKILEVDEFQDVTLDLYPEIKSNELDSVSIVLYASMREIKVKNVQLDILNKKE